MTAASRRPLPASFARLRPRRFVNGVAAARLLVAMLVVVLPSRVRSEPAPSAAALFDEGLTALDRGELDQACAKLSQSQKLEPRVGTLLNLADCEERRGRLVAAAEGWRGAHDLATATNDPRATEAQRRRDRLEPRIPRLTLDLAPGAPAAVVVTRVRGADESVEMRVGAPAEKLDPGSYRLVATAPGRRERSYDVELAPGDDRVVTVDVGPADTEEPSASAASWSPINSAGAALGGLGVVSLIVGAVFGSEAISKQDESSAHCDASNLCDQAGVELRDEGLTAARVSTATIVIGSALAVGGLAMMLVPSEPEVAAEGAPTGSSAAAAARSSARPAVALRLAPLGLSAAVRW